MFYKPLLLPLLLQVLLTFVVWLRMYQVRLREINERQIDPQSLATRRDGAARLSETAASDNFANQFELPVLFYVAVLLALTLLWQDAILVTLTWLFVAGRAAHALIHLTYNRVMHRFAAYCFSALALFGMWARLGWYIVSN